MLVFLDICLESYSSSILMGKVKQIELTKIFC